ncbi:alpha/beta hydrolase [Spirosoma sp. KNUC1025]|uniref:alpha/beta hydrolase n=1 Tax=Spirosoma sp. KNUC1025 TaxID=2894082 RepID=UPI0038638264|nr:alpha/beta hydrolase [Spirosoma sp. KNUC1025]
MKTLNNQHVVFITGAFVTHHCWDEWQTYFQSKGYTTLAPPWPYKDGTAIELRARQPHDKDLALLTLAELVDHYVGIIKSLPEKPIVIGHSYGGMLTQLMADKDLAVAGVAIHSIPPQGVFPYEFSFLKAGWKSLGLFTDLEETYMMSFEDWQYAFVNGMPLEQQQSTYDQFTIPESKTVARGALTSVAKVDFAKPHVPLLFTAGDLDHITPAHLNLRNFRAYEFNGSVLDYKLFSGRNHFVLGLPTWKEDADFILKWLETNVN